MHLTRMAVQRLGLIAACGLLHFDVVAMGDICQRGSCVDKTSTLVEVPLRRVCADQHETSP